MNEIPELKAHIEAFRTSMNSFSNPFHTFIAKLLYYALTGIIYNGLFTPGENFPRGKEYFKKALDIADEYHEVLHSQDKWFIIFFDNFVTLNKAYFTDDLSQKLDFINKCLELSRTMPVDSDAYILMYNLELTMVLIPMGKLNEAYDSIVSLPKTHNIFFIFMQFESLANISYIRGDLFQALDFMKQNLELIEKKEFYWGISRLKGNLGNLYEEMDDLENAKKCFIESLALRKTLPNVYDIAFAYYNIIKFFTTYYEIKGEDEFLQEAKNYLQEFEEYSNNQDEIIVKNLNLICEALILEFGRLSDKSKSYNILKELVPYFPFLTELKIHLIDLLIEETKINTNNPEVLKDIIIELDNLMSQLSKIALYLSRISIVTFINYQILIARYYYSIKGNISGALDILKSALKELDNFELPILKERIQSEINNITSQMLKWQNSSLTVQDRLQKSDFEEYFRQMMKINTKIRE